MCYANVSKLMAPTCFCIEAAYGGPDCSNPLMGVCLRLPTKRATIPTTGMKQVALSVPHIKWPIGAQV